MTWLAFLISIAYIPGWTGISIPTGWAAMSVTLPWVKWSRVEVGSLHLLGAAFLFYAFLTLGWAVNFNDALNELWHLSILAFAFMLGSRVRLGRIWDGLAWGCGVSSVVAIAQWFSPQIIAEADPGKMSGLFFNNATAGAVAAVVIVAQRDSTRWLLALPLLLLSQSRGAWLALLVTCFLSAGKYPRLMLVCLLFPIALFFWPQFHTSTDEIRLVMWQSTISHFTWFGMGAGGMMSAYAVIHGQLLHLEHAHNDYLTLFVHYGIGAIPLFILMGWCATRINHTEWPAFICLAILAGYFWVLESPVPAFAFAVVAGRICTDTDSAWDRSVRRGLGFLSRFTLWPTMASGTSGVFLSPRLDHKE